MAMAEYSPKEGQITGSAGFVFASQFQDYFFNKNENSMNFNGSQSFAGFFRLQGDVNIKNSLFLDFEIQNLEFEKKQGIYADIFHLHGPVFELGFLRRLNKNIWGSTALGAFYPWHLSQKLESQSSNYSKSRFYSIYNFSISLQWEFLKSPYYCGVEFKKYMSGLVDDQSSIGFYGAYRF